MITTPEFIILKAGAILIGAISGGMIARHKIGAQFINLCPDGCLCIVCRLNQIYFVDKKFIEESGSK